MKSLQALVVAASMASGLAAMANGPAAALTPVDMRGIWFSKDPAGAAKCAAFLGKKPVEPDEGALVISEKQMVLWGTASQNTMHFVTDVQPRRTNTWRLQTLIDEPPYDKPKYLETYVIELRQNELLWSKRRVEDALSEKVDTAVFARCRN